METVGSTHSQFLTVSYALNRFTVSRSRLCSAAASIAPRTTLFCSFKKIADPWMAQPVKTILVALVVWAGVPLGASACSDGSQPSCAIAFNTTPASWSQGVYYDPGISVEACTVNATTCASAFRGFYAGGLTCDEVGNVTPQSNFVAIAVVAFIVGACSLCTPCLTPTCCCGKPSPTIVCVGAFALHLGLFCVAAMTLTSSVAAVNARAGGWSSATMGVALAATVSGSPSSAHVLFKPQSMRPFLAIDALAGVATGPVGLILVIIVLLVLGSGGKGGGKGPSMDCSLDCCGGNCASSCGSLCQCVANSCSNTICGIHCHVPDCSFCSSPSFWWGPAWWWWGPSPVSYRPSPRTRSCRCCNSVSQTCAQAPPADAVVVFAPGSASYASSGTAVDAAHEIGMRKYSQRASNPQLAAGPVDERRRPPPDCKAVGNSVVDLTAADPDPPMDEELPQQPPAVDWHQPDAVSPDSASQSRDNVSTLEIGSASVATLNPGVVPFSAVSSAPVVVVLRSSPEPRREVGGRLFTREN